MCLVVLWSSPGFHPFILGLCVVSAFDVVGVSLAQRLRSPSLWDSRFAAIRDAAYALVFYSAFVQSPQTPALILFPSVLTELFVLFGSRTFYRGVILEICLVFIRMAAMAHRLHHLLHPSWSIGIGVASVVTGLLGLEISRLEELQGSIVRQREQMRETITEMLTATLSSSGVGDGVVQQENISQMVEEICRAANRSKGREIGKRLAQAVAIKQAAASLLTSREQEVLRLVAQSKSYRQIAQRLQVSEGTVRAHAAAIMRKANVHCRDDLVHWGQTHKLLPDTQKQDGKSTSAEAE